MDKRRIFKNKNISEDKRFNKEIMVKIKMTKEG